MRAHARRTDPATSHEAAAAVDAEGKTERDRRLCLERVNLRLSETAAEIAQAIGMERHVPSRRLPELRDQAHLVDNGPARKCRVVGRPSMTWEPAGPAPAVQGRLFSD